MTNLQPIRTCFECVVCVILSRVLGAIFLRNGASLMNELLMLHKALFLSEKEVFLIRFM